MGVEKRRGGQILPRFRVFAVAALAGALSSSSIGSSFQPHTLPPLSPPPIFPPGVPPEGWLPPVACDAPPGPPGPGIRRLKSEFPRLGGVKIGAPHNYLDPTVQQKLAKLDFVVIDFHAAWGPKAKREVALKGIRARNPNIILIDYVMAQYLMRRRAATIGRMLNKIDAERWWLYAHGTTPPEVTSTAGRGFFAGTGTTNLTNWVRPDANGDRFNTWLAKYFNTHQYWSQMANLDGQYTDAFFWQPKESGDWDVNGSTDSGNEPRMGTGYRQGYMAYVNQIRAVMPGKLVTGNLGRWGTPEAVFPEYLGKLDGGVLEHYIGVAWSRENLGWPMMMYGYRKVKAALSPLKLIILDQKGRDHDYQAFRYGFASTLMDDGYYSFSSADQGIYKPASFVWFDEYDLAGTADTKWLGKALDPPQFAPYQKGVYMRRFQGGAVLVNPKNNGRQTVAVPPGLKRFRGKQAPSVNNGQPATAVTLKDRDGLVLVRDGPPVPCRSDG